MSNPVSVIAIGFFLIGLSYIGNGTIGMFMPGPRTSKLIVLALSVATAIGCFGISSAILGASEVGQGGPLGLDLVGWFFVFIAAQGIGTWALVIYRTIWVYRNWGKRTVLADRNTARDTGRDSARDPARDKARDKERDEWWGRGNGDGR